MEGVDPAHHVDVDDAVQGRDQVGQLMVGGAQVDRAFERFVEQGRGRPGVAVFGSFGAGLGGELDPGADDPDVGVVEQLALGQSHRDAVGIGFAGGCRQD